jgi:hypothetical protein
MKEANVRPKLHPMDDGGNGLTLLPAAPYVISKLEKTMFIKNIQTMFIKNIRELKAPSNYVGQLSKKITVDGKLQGLKSHNYHISMQQIMPLCL